MDRFQNFLRLFPISRELQQTNDLKTYIIMAPDGRTYVLADPVSQSPADLERLIETVLFMANCSRDQLRIGRIQTADQEEGLLAEFEDTSRPDDPNRFEYIVFHPNRKRIMWVGGGNSK